jgi:hypothetical protein
VNKIIFLPLGMSAEERILEVIVEERVGCNLFQNCKLQIDIKEEGDKEVNRVLRDDRRPWKEKI